MNLEEVRKDWQTLAFNEISGPDAKEILEHVRRDSASLDASVFRRDCIECTLGVLMALFWLYGGIFWGEHLWLVTALSCLFVSGFLYVDRRIRHRKRPTCDSTLAACIQVSIHDLQHQIWLLRNVFWWYLLPLGVGLLAFAASTAWKMRFDTMASLLILIGCLVPCLLVFVWVFRLNQRTVQHVLTPRCQDLEALQGELNRV